MRNSIHIGLLTFLMLFGCSAIHYQSDRTDDHSIVKKKVDKAANKLIWDDSKPFSEINFFQKPPAGFILNKRKTLSNKYIKKNHLDFDIATIITDIENSDVVVSIHLMKIFDSENDAKSFFNLIEEGLRSKFKNVPSIKSKPFESSYVNWFFQDYNEWTMRVMDELEKRKESSYIRSYENFSISSILKKASVIVIYLKDIRKYAVSIHYETNKAMELEDLEKEENVKNLKL